MNRLSSVIVNSVELFVRQGTGIRTFSRSVVAALAGSESFSLDLLVSTASETGSGVLAGSNILQKHKKNSRLPKVFSVLRVKLKHYISLPFWPAVVKLQRVPAEHPLHNAILDKCLEEATRDYLSHANNESQVIRTKHRGFLYAKNLFEDAQVSFKLNRSLVRLSLPRSMRSGRDDRIVFHSPLPYPVLVDGCVNITTIHDLIPVSHPDLCLDDPAYFYDLVDSLLDSCQGIHCISRYTADQIDRFFGSKAAKKLFVAHQPIPLAHLNDDFEVNALRRYRARHLPSSGEGKYILQVGSIEPKKNHSTTLEAFRRLREKDSSLRLVIIGKPGWLTEDLCDYLATAKPDGIEWLRAASFGTLVRYMQSASAVVFPSLVEGWGLPPLEAMSHGVPVVASPIPPCKEACESAALYITNPLDSISLSRHIDDVINNPDYAEDLIRKGFGQAKRYNARQFASDLLKGYSRVC
jgi:glycosyltransferase involved in cell wall biosynthesis